MTDQQAQTVTEQNFAGPVASATLIFVGFTPLSRTSDRRRHVRFPRCCGRLWQGCRSGSTPISSRSIVQRRHHRCDEGLTGELDPI